MPKQAIMSDGDHIEFEVFGNQGPFVFYGPQLYLNSPIPNTDELMQAYVNGLKDRYRVILSNWPRGIGNSSPAKGSSGTWQNSMDDIHRIADAAGADKFAWWGYSFGAAVGLQLAAKSDRVSAFVCGGFPPLWQPLSDMLSVARRTAVQPLPEEMKGGVYEDPEMGLQPIAFYESVAGQDEAAAIRQIKCPCMVFHDTDDIFEIHGFNHDLSMRTRAAEAELKELGWEVAWVETGMGHMAPGNSKACMDAFVPFLDRILLGQ